MGLRDVVVASTTGTTGAKAVKVFEGFNVVAIGHCYGFKEAGRNEMDESLRKEIVAAGGKLLFGIHALSSVERAVKRDLNTVMPLELMASVLKRMGQGTKVCVEITLMAADAGLIPVDSDVLAIAGSSRGADTALIIHPACVSDFFKLKIKEITAKPNDF